MDLIQQVDGNDHTGAAELSANDLNLMFHHILKVTVKTI